MKKLRIVAFSMAALALLSMSAGVASAANLLLNANLDNLPTNVSGATINSWNVDMTKDVTGPTTDLITLEDFPKIGPDTSALPVRDLAGFVKAFQGNNNTGDRANLRLSQDVPASPGQKFVLSAYIGAGESYSGLQTNPTGLDTQTLLEIIFDNDNNRTNGDLGRLTYDVKAAGLASGPCCTFGNQLFTTPAATAPAGTTFVRAQFAALEMYNTTNPDPSAFVDDFNLEIVPEPASIALGLLGMIGLVGLVRRRG